MTKYLWKVRDSSDYEPTYTPLEIAYRMGFIDATQLDMLANKYAKNGYGEYLKQVLTEQVF